MVGMVSLRRPMSNHGLEEVVIVVSNLNDHLDDALIYCDNEHTIAIPASPSVASSRWLGMFAFD